MTDSIKNRILYLFTEDYPYANSETFIENEIKILSDNFEDIIIITKNTTSDSKRQTPENVTIIRKKFNLSFFEKIASLVYVFTRKIKDEFFFLRKKKINLSKTNISYMLLSSKKGNKIASFLTTLISSESSEKKRYLYSYWWLDEAIGIAQFKKEHPEVIAFTRCHGYDVYSERSKGNYLPLKRFTLKYLDKVFSISNDGKTYIENNYIDNADFSSKLAVSKLGVKFGGLRILENKNTAIFTIVSCSQIYPNKRVDLIFEAISKLNTRVQWIHFGDYMEGISENYQKNLIQKFESPLNKNISIDFKGNLSNTEIHDFYDKNTVDLFINVSQSEGISVSIMEAMAYSIPVLATNVGGTSEIVDNNNGVLLEPNINSSELCAKIDSFFQLDLNQINNKRKAAFETFNDHYNATKNYQSFVDEIDKLNIKQ